MDNSNTESKRVAIIQARMDASRLPGKVLLDIGGEPMLVRVVERTLRAQNIDQVVVATSLHEADNPIQELCEDRQYSYYRGSMRDVLDRYYQTAKLHSAEVVIRITADCPIIDPIVVDQTMAAFYGIGASLITKTESATSKLFEKDIVPAFDFAANRLPPPWQRTFPIGMDTEICTFAALEKAWRAADKPHHREHVMPYLYENDDKFKILLVNHEPDYGYLRWTVDTPQDLDLLRLIYSRFEGRDDFSWLEILDLLEAEPEIMDINANVVHHDYRAIDERE
jgi:spore coat polysaccharide biosynthesis protein SpsF